MIGATTLAREIPTSHLLFQEFASSWSWLVFASPTQKRLVSGLGFRVHGLRFRVLGFRVKPAPGDTDTCDVK
jgi:hypothetical protein